MYKIYVIRLGMGSNMSYTYDAYSSFQEAKRSVMRTMPVVERMYRHRNDEEFNDDVAIIYEFTNTTGNLSDVQKRKILRDLSYLDFDDYGKGYLKERKIKFDIKTTDKIYVASDGSLWRDSSFSGLREMVQPIGTILSGKKPPKSSEYTEIRKGPKRDKSPPRGRKTRKTTKRDGGKKAKDTISNIATIAVQSLKIAKKI